MKENAEDANRNPTQLLPKAPDSHESSSFMHDAVAQ